MNEAGVRPTMVCTGRCCEQITLKIPLAQLAARGTMEDRQIVDRQIVGMLEPTGWGYRDGAVEYRCKNFDPESRLCRIYRDAAKDVPRLPARRTLRGVRARPDQRAWRTATRKRRLWKLEHHLIAV